MIGKSIGLIALAIMVFVFAFSLALPAQAQPEKMVRVLVGYNGSPGTVKQEIVKNAGGHIGYTSYRTRVLAATMPESGVQALRESANVSFIEQDSEIQTYEQLPWGVDSIDADFVHPYNKGTGIKVAILDSGIDMNHPDLNVQGGVSCVSYTDSWDDDHGHGTHVAGIVAALDNTIGFVGVAPEVKLYAVKVMGSNSKGYWSNIIAGIDWAIDNGMQVINMSLGAISGSTALKTACDNAWNAGIVLVGAAGNNDAAGTVIYPAKYDSVIAVAAIDHTNTRADFSDIGPEVELAAPGVNIHSTYMNGNYAIMSGTSMASPFVAGTAALVIASGIMDANGNGRINDEVRQRLDVTAHDLGLAGRDVKYGYGLVNASDACNIAPPTDSIDHYSITSINSVQLVGVPFIVTIQAQDQFNNNVNTSNEVVNISFSPSSTGATPTSTSTINGKATVSMIIAKAQSDQTIIFTGATSHATGISNSFNVISAVLPTVPILYSPAENSTVSNQIPRLEWNSSNETSSYDIQISTSYNFTTLTANQRRIFYTYYDVPEEKLEWNTRYYWRVNTTNADGTSGWSDYWQFKTPSKPQTPLPPSLLPVGQRSTIPTLNPKLPWIASTRATSYAIQISDNSRFTTLLIDQSGINATSYDVPSGVLSMNTTYYWRVSAINANGASRWSVYKQFKTYTGLESQITQIANY